MTATCSEAALGLGESTAGTASTISSWVLVEHDGPWGEDTREEVFAATLGAERWAELTELWLGRQLRPLLVRRPAGHPEGRRGARRSDPRPSRVLVGSALRTPFVEVTEVDALASLDLAALADGRPGHGRPVAGPLLLVCTNGAVDRCCATAGRTLVATLAAAHPDLVWESTHLGGCRFAGNLLVLPAAQMHGRLAPGDALEVVRTAVSGRVAPTGWRGETTRSAWSAVARAHLADRLGLASPTDLAVHHERPHADVLDGEDGPEPAGCDVVLAHDGRRWRVVVRAEVRTAAATLCTDAESWPVPAVASVDRLA